jgi:riboflavin kinase / FMN adenylyltransferase
MMRFKSFQIKGKGRGKFLGFPTINLQIPTAFSLEDGIYAVITWVDNKKYISAMHYGPIPVFKEDKKSLEIFVIDAPLDFQVKENQEIEFEIHDKLRNILDFPTHQELSSQISQDVENVKRLLQ